MKKVIFFIFLSIIIVSNVYASNVTALSGNSSSSSNTSYDAYCNPEIKEFMENTRDSRIQAEATYINSQHSEKPSVMPTEDESDDACFTAPELSTSGIEDELSTTYNKVAGKVTSVINGAIGVAGDIYDNITSLLTGDVSGVLGSLGGLLNDLCLSLVDEATDAKDSIITLDSYKSEFNTIPYVKDNFRVRNNSISFTTYGIEHDATSATADILDD